MPLTKNREKSYKDLRSESLLNLFPYALRKILLGSLVFSLISIGVYFHRGYLTYLGEFSIVSAILLGLFISFMYGVYIIGANLVGGTVTYLILADSGVSLNSVIAATVIGGNVGRDWGADKLLEKYESIPKRKADIAVLAGILFWSFLVLITGLFIFLSVIGG